jgi:phosphoribosylformylglycinamidine cyclo-ligase
VQGFTTACKENGCALIGGETAEMPDLYNEGEYDLAGTIVGIVEKEQILDGSRVEAGDVLIGLPSTGLHTNGYSLARKVLFRHFEIDEAPKALGRETVGQALLHIHRSYLHTIRQMIAQDLAHAFVHVTGGGIPGNTARIIPDGLQFVVDYSAWERPALFRLIQDVGNVPEEDMRRTFNLGIVLIAVVPGAQVEAAKSFLSEAGEHPILLGSVSSS